MITLKLIPIVRSNIDYLILIERNLRRVFSKIRMLLKLIYRTFFRLVLFNWIDVLLMAVTSFVFYLIYSQITENRNHDYHEILSDILTINSIFSAILITYLFTRIVWVKERKLDEYKFTVSISQKITDFRRIFEKLTRYYNVWASDAATKNLIDHNKFAHIDYYDYWLSSISDYKPKDYDLIEELKQHKNFSEGVTNLYLAMAICHNLQYECYTGG